MSVYTKLSDARAKFHAMKLEKTGHNKFAGYKYFDLSDFIVPALQVFKECGLIGVVSFGKEMASLTIVDLESNEKMVVESPMSTASLKGCHEVQNLGAVETYVRRYLWVAALEIVEHDAIDSSQPIKEEKKALIIPARPAIEVDAETESFLKDLAGTCVDLVKNGQAKEAWQSIQAAALDDDQTIALANMMDSATRNAIKKAKV
jgi:hypothetical protein